ncbi:MAG: YdcF family protein [Lachnospiraceae bacterium]|nr:YdcF family protein [Lachnospiraceae bacterium]
MILWGLFFLSAAAFIIVMLTDRRTVLSGFFLLLSVLLPGCLLISEAMKRPAWFSEHLLVHLLLDLALLFTALLFVAYPLLLIPVFLISGVINIKKEGIRPRNALSMGLALVFLAFELVYPLLFDVRTPGLSVWIYWYLTLLCMYFVIQFVSFSLSALLNLIHFRKNRGLRYVVVLGAGLSGTEPTPLLKARIDRGIRVYRDNPGAKLLFSGGQGKDEAVAESEAMAAYAVSAGVFEGDIVKEDRSENTEENIRFSAELMEEPGEFAIVTSSYHVLRALLIARRKHLPCVGYGARTKLYFSLNAFLREYAGYCRDRRLLQAVGLVLLTAVYLLFIFTMK